MLCFLTGKQLRQSSKLSLYLVVGLGCLVIVVLTNAYTSTLMSYLAVPKFQPIVNTLEDLATIPRGVKIT